jgi:hypothetical protein
MIYNRENENVHNIGQGETAVLKREPPVKFTAPQPISPSSHLV